MMNLILLGQAHLDPSKHVSCYWAFDLALIFRSMWAVYWTLSMIWALVLAQAISLGVDASSLLEFLAKALIVENRLR